MSDFEAVYDRPDDDAPRQAVAARLKKKGDPRGEFIEIQLAPSPTDAQRKRAAALLKTHRAEWKEPFEVEGSGYGIHNERWERGFPVHGFATVFYPHGPRAWRTVRSLVVDQDTRYHFLKGPLVEELRELTWDGWYAGSFAPFCREARIPKLEALRWCGPWQPGDEGWKKGYEKLSKFKKLVTLAIDPALVASEPWFWESKITKRLKHLELCDQIENPAGCVEHAEGLPLLERLTFTDKPRASKDPQATFAVHHTRGADGKLSVVTVEKLRTPIDEVALARFATKSLLVE